MAKSKKVAGLGSVLADVFQKRNWQRRLKLHQVFLFWDEVVGREIAFHARPCLIKGDVLWVDVSDPIWMQQLQFEKHTLLTRINQRLAGEEDAASTDNAEPLKLRDLRFQPASLKGSDKKVKSIDQDAAPVIDPVKLKRFEETISTLEDPELRESMRRLWLTMQARQEPKI